jgi:hypothetical protein
MSENLSPVMVINNSGVILSKLNSVKECSFYDLMVLSGLDEMDFYIAIGYLLSERKIIFVPVGNSIQIHLI